MRARFTSTATLNDFTGVERGLTSESSHSFRERGRSPTVWDDTTGVSGVHVGAIGTTG
jgi:hypothetical protein